jgi:hypothetical protein
MEDDNLSYSYMLRLKWSWHMQMKPLQWWFLLWIWSTELTGLVGFFNFPWILMCRHSWYQWLNSNTSSNFRQFSKVSCKTTAMHHPKTWSIQMLFYFLFVCIMPDPPLIYMSYSKYEKCLDLGKDFSDSNTFALVCGFHL